MQILTEQSGGRGGLTKDGLITLKWTHFRVLLTSTDLNLIPLLFSFQIALNYSILYKGSLQKMEHLLWNCVHPLKVSDFHLKICNLNLNPILNIIGHSQQSCAKGKEGPWCEYECTHQSQSPCNTSSTIPAHMPLCQKVKALWNPVGAAAAVCVCEEALSSEKALVYC